ncbi:MAG: MBL fold metallo-hydrolase [Fusobacteriaceae bacterium]|jgi:glyoxylase-like metal-dependent hydrolase (beta-lactamase superfamily II)|nr:MBL fold metallo-hydrolase [Fusobacteriaceae bacterium]
MKKLLCLCLFLLSLTNILFAQNVKSYSFGKSTFISLKDKDTEMGKSILLKPDAEIVKKILGEGTAKGSINAFILKTGDKTILIDTGLGKSGDLLDALKNAKIEPIDIDTILLTHMHGDHIGGLVDTDKKVFEKAIVYVNEKELDYWINGTPKNKGNADMVRKVKDVYGDNLKVFDWDTEIIPSIKAINAVGHTPGHTAFELDFDGSDKLLVIGDLVHSLNVQMADPSMSVTFDVNPDEAAKTRIKIFEYVASEKIKIAGMHIPFSGVGYIIKGDGNSYRFEPLE